MRLKIQIGDSEVDVGKEFQRGVGELNRIRRQEAERLKQLRARHAPAERKVIAGLNRAVELLGYRLVPARAKTTAAPSLDQRPGRSARRSARPKPKVKRR